MDWQPIDTAPKDGTLIDVWCSPVGEFYGMGGPGIRLCNIAWHKGSDVFKKMGWVRLCDDGNYDLVEGGPCKGKCGLPPWKPTHWMQLPEPPKVK